MSVELDVFTIAYGVRKLMDANKLSDELEQYRVPLESYAPHGTPIDIHNWDKIDRHYDLSEWSRVELRIREFCNQFIHSHVFLVCQAEDGGLDGLFVTSDRDRYRRLLRVSIDSYLAFVEAVVEDDIRFMEMRRDQDSGEMEMIRKSCSSRDRS